MNGPPAAPAATRVTPAFQAALAGMVTNKWVTRLYLDSEDRDDLPTLGNDDREVLEELGRQSGARLMTLAALLSQRRFNRAAQLLPASRRILADAFDTRWNAYLGAATPGTPTATEEAVRFAQFLRAERPADPLTADVLRYEESLNEASRRLIGRRPPPPARPLAPDDRVRLSDYVLLETFDHDVVASVKALRQSADVRVEERGRARTLLFRPKHDRGVAVDVSILPDELAACLLQARNPTPVAALVQTAALKAQPGLGSKLDYLVRVGVLAPCPAADAAGMRSG